MEQIQRKIPFWRHCTSPVDRAQQTQQERVSLLFIPNTLFLSGERWNCACPDMQPIQPSAVELFELIDWAMQGTIICMDRIHCNKVCLYIASKRASKNCYNPGTSSRTLRQFERLYERYWTRFVLAQVNVNRPWVVGALSHIKRDCTGLNCDCGIMHTPLPM